MGVRLGQRGSVALLLLVAVVGWLTACAEPAPTPRSEARVVSDRAELLGGIRALGDVGDVLLQNDHVRVVIQQPGFSRGFGVYGGSLIDAAPRRADPEGDQLSGRGVDTFGELFPAFFLQAMAVDTMTIVSDGRDGGPAVVEVSGTAGDFLELTGVLNRAAVGSHEDYLDARSEQRVRYQTRYELHPGDRHVRLTFTLQNLADEPLEIPGPNARSLLGLLGLQLDGFTVPIGDVALYGALSRVFLPGEGFDVRYGLARSYERGIEWPAFPGIVVDWVASRGQGASYGLLAAESDNNYVWNKRDIYDSEATPVTRGSMLVPFIASGFLGVFHHQAPAVIEPGGSFSVDRYFLIGTGDVGSVLDEVHRIRGTTTGVLRGVVHNDRNDRPAAGTSVMVYRRLADGTRRPFAQYDAQSNGAFGGTLPPGSYSTRVTGSGRFLSPYVDVEIRASQTTAIRLAAPEPGRVVVSVQDGAGVPLPAKVTIVGTYDAERSNQATRDFLFDLAAGASYRVSDLVADDPQDPSTRRYVEAIGFTDHGIADLFVRPGSYRVYVSRGPEYALAVHDLEVRAGGTATLSTQLARVVNTDGWIAADFHIHSANSIDAPIDVYTRALTLGAEGVEWAVMTDHNYVTDLSPEVRRAGLAPWVHTTVGLELTTLESGHFNGYPLTYRVGPITHGAFAWARRTPDEIFAAIRGLGEPGETVVQVNHPRDSIIGYFDQYNRSGLTAGPIRPGLFDRFLSPSGPAFVDEDGKSTFSLDFDVIEVLNGKLYWQIHHHRIPWETPEELLPRRALPGEILLDDNEVAYPGAVDDWFNLLNLGERFLPAGTSDTHNDGEEPGSFRTMIRVENDNPADHTDASLIAAFRTGDVVATNGPLIDFSLQQDGARPGGDAFTSTGTVTARIEVRSAPWIPVERLNVFRNGLLVHSEWLPEGRDLATSPYQTSLELPLDVDGEGTPKDSWFVVQVIGYESLFPAVLPLEEPPLNLTDAVGSLAGPLGLGGDDGELAPSLVFQVTPLAITNAIFVRTQADRAWEAPGLTPATALRSADNAPGWPRETPDRSATNKHIALPVGRTIARWTGQAELLRVNPFAVFRWQGGNPIDWRGVFQPCGWRGAHAH